MMLRSAILNSHPKWGPATVARNGCNSGVPSRGIPNGNPGQVGEAESVKLLFDKGASVDGKDNAESKGAVRQSGRRQSRRGEFVRYQVRQHRER
jgi:hypothetical protein